MNLTIAIDQIPLAANGGSAQNFLASTQCNCKMRDNRNKCGLPHSEHSSIVLLLTHFLFFHHIKRKAATATDQRCAQGEFLPA